MKKYIVFLIASIFLISCKKQENWLDIKSNKTDIIPVTLDDFESLLNNDRVMNGYYPGLGIIGSDNYSVSFSTWQQCQQDEKNAYLWETDIFEGANSADWRYPYTAIAYANVVLEGLAKINPDESEKKQYNQLKGSALFLRGYSFCNLVQLFANPFNENTSDTDPGIVLKLISDVNERVTRSTVQQTYDRIFLDLEEAEKLLPDVAGSALIPSRVAVLSLMARINLSIEKYQQSLSYSVEALKLQNELIDFNTLDTLSKLPLPGLGAGNTEVVFYSSIIPYHILDPGYMIIDSQLYHSYDPDDLRRSIFYRKDANNDPVFKGNYTGTTYDFFAGIATNELYLIAAESYARNNMVTEAMSYLNKLLIMRWKHGTFNPYTAVDSEDALRLILNERRKELPFTGILRWDDLRRLNKDPKFEKTLVRHLNAETVTLPPNDNRYVYPIPEIEIQINKLIQNPR